MAASILNDLVLLLNQQIASQEILTQKLAKIEAFAEVILNTKFTPEPIPTTQYNCGWILCDLIQEARLLSEQTFNMLLKNSKDYLH